MLEGRTIAIATKHKKENVIAPILKRELNLYSKVPNIDTDQLGTFSGEIERVLTPVDSARKKCALAIDHTGLDLAISSEGSFGSHPTVFLANANEEIVLMLDRKNHREYIGRSLTTDTNLSGAYVKNINEAYQFCENIGFPEHAIIIKDREEHFTIAFKGIQQIEEVKTKVFQLLKSQNSVWLETDMRACFNPTRMKNIEKATLNLVERIQSCCPQCNLPGFWKVEAIRGLQCKDCHRPTNSIKAHIYGCDSCKYEEVRNHHQPEKHEDPTYCDYCNP